MANVKLKEEDQILLQGEAVNISPLGFDCEISLDAIPTLRDAAGRFRMLDMELQLQAHKGAVTVYGSASVLLCSPCCSEHWPADGSLC